MKSNFSKNRIFILLFVAVTAMSVVSCIQDEEVVEPPFHEALPGTWDITSYLYGGDEWMGLIADSANITFEAPVGDGGLFREQVVFVDDWTRDIMGRYVIDEEHHQVTLYYNGELIIADITITGDKMQWISELDEEPLIIKATKRK